MTIKTTKKPRTSAEFDKHDLHIYSSGVCSMSVCVPKEMMRPQIARLANEKNRTGIKSEWAISKDKTFHTGQQMPCVCDSDDNRMHYMLNC